MIQEQSSRRNNTKQYFNTNNWRAGVILGTHSRRARVALSAKRSNHQSHKATAVTVVTAGVTHVRKTRAGQTVL